MKQRKFTFFQKMEHLFILILFLSSCAPEILTSIESPDNTVDKTNTSTETHLLPSSKPHASVQPDSLPEILAKPTIAPSIKPLSSPTAAVTPLVRHEIPNQNGFKTKMDYWETSDPTQPFLVFAGADLQTSQITSPDKERLIQYFEDFLMEKPGEPDLVYNLSSASLLAGKYEKSLQLSLELLKIYPKSIPVLYNQALALLKLGRHHELQPIIEFFNKYFETQHLNQPEALFVYLLAQAMKEYFNELVGFNPAMIHSLGEYWLQSAKEPNLKALALYYQYAKTFPHIMRDDARIKFEEALQIKPNSALFKVSHARALLREKQFDLAYNTLQEALKINPDSALAYLAFSELYEAQQKPFDDIVQALNKAQEKSPMWFRPAEKLRDLYEAKGNYPEALTALNKVLNITQASLQSLIYKKADLLFKLKRYAEAITEYSNYMDYMQKFEQNYYSRYDRNSAILARAKALYFLRTATGNQKVIEDLTGIIEEFRHLEKYLPAQITPTMKANYTSALYMRGVLYFETSNFQKAYEDYLVALQKKPDSLDYKYNLAGTLGTLKRYDEAIKLYLEIPISYTNIIEVYKNLSLAYAYTGKCEVSNKYAELAKINPKSCTAL